MPELDIRRPRLEDSKELHKFWRKVITDAYAQEGISDQLDSLEEEIHVKEQQLADCFAGEEAGRFILVALVGDQIVGTMGYGPASPLIVEASQQALAGWTEVGTVYVDPAYQRRGVSRQLLKAIGEALQARGIRQFCLDSGYRAAQQAWTRTFGEPAYILKDYYGEGGDHMIWTAAVKGNPDKSRSSGEVL
ncbi:GNAT family N-acetyltransferase [Paenibacillus sp. JX-17]|uniref:GNAT family N-acetyltransferase n=1 Tax=Paenibacillus lacisoli TaxID=3064525 RepID=A0ABT9CEF9_9BACL|nr:GNAT family N-acetyltransferase [Paenibacillus sp. JX-17]MDO7907606.1 GNAT family N-acetyltransferase [Paenibacillus sp. JX-17]